ncbi:hypothetical protein N657DRAFT_678723 [Parathielavia appendiculata]|uniref:Uncharacterized protein n=1 Tax=Parathielavia appendiculata TaxID=2587402 RepID=A0AAN6U381_9PEZI|nr:hypothetical protein N657DRAFT_678723 [Parathielavia appendiculata]
MAWQDHHALHEIQWPTLVPTVFCEPIAVGGPHGLGFNFSAWPILVPAEEGVHMCYTHDERFRGTCLKEGFCGINESFREQFGYDCPQQTVQCVIVKDATDQQHARAKIGGNKVGWAMWIWRSKILGYLDQREKRTG